MIIRRFIRGISNSGHFSIAIMRNLFRELGKVIGQLCGWRNIFGYRTTVANQLYLFYCFSGKIYFCDKIDKTVKYLWCFLLLSQTIISYGAILAYFWYESNKDIVMLMNLANVFGVSTVGGFGFPLISYLHSKDIEAMIKHVDNSLEAKLNSGSKQKRVIAEAKSVFGWIMGPFIVCNLIYISICFFDVALFFEESKVQNYLFYMLPVPLIREYDGYWFYFIVNGISIVVFEIAIVQFWCVLAVILYWITVCRNELMCIRDYLDGESSDMSRYAGKNGVISGSWRRTFEFMVRRGIKQFQETIALIDFLRGFIETAGSIFVLMTFFYGIAVLHLGVSGDLLFILKLKYLAGYLATTFAAYQFYWVGENLDRSVIEVSLAIYSTPWYWSSKVRKNVYILLCHTQYVKELSFMKVYGLLLKNFSRYLHGEFSYTNFLRKLTNK